jgi:hypothetical protein
MSLLPGKITICNVKGVSERERERAVQTSGGGWKTDGIGGGVPEPAVRLPLPTDKTEVDTQQGTIGQLDGIGYTVDRIANRVGISARNKAKAFNAAWAIGDGIGTRLKAVQRVASHGSRYKAVVPMMAPFTKALHSACKGHNHPHATFDLSKEAMGAVWMMRILLVLSEVLDREFTRSFKSFELRDNQPEWIIEYDASLMGLAVIWFKVQQCGAEVAVGCGAIDLRHKGYESSGLMNTLELMAATVGLWKLKEKGVRDTAIGVRGDNMTAMEWAESKGFRSAHAQKTAIAFTALSVEAGLEVVQKTHLPHTKKYDNNWRTDKPSRHQMTWDEVRKEDARDRVTGRRLGEEMEEWDMKTAAYLCEMCDPMEERRTEEFVVKKVLEMTGWGEKSERRGREGWEGAEGETNTPQQNSTNLTTIHRNHGSRHTGGKRSRKGQPREWKPTTAKGR